MARGRLRIYLGAAPGVGKTYAMLGEGRRRQERGTDVVIGFLETHGREHTAEMAVGLEQVHRAMIEYRGSTFPEMDTEAVLARRPAVALIDELAHTSADGRKRYVDVERIRDAGIDVISTVNIQHLESLNDIVKSITGVEQRETIPDAVVRAADQIELVDMSPEALRRRLAHGNVYAADKVDAALGNYFREGNLTALRELALLWVADRVEEGLERYRAKHGITQTWRARERIVVAVTGTSESEALLRRGSVIAGRVAGRDLAAVHVVRGDGTVGAAPDALARLRQLTEDLGGTFHVVVGENIPAAILDFARSVNGTQVVVGVSRRGRLSTLIRQSPADLVVGESGDIDVHVVTHEPTPRPARSRRRTPVTGRQLVSWGLALLVPMLITALMLPLRADLNSATELLVYLLGVVGVALIGGLAQAAVTSVVAGLLANWFFTPPYYTWTIAEPQSAFSLLVFIVVGVLVAYIVDVSRSRARKAVTAQSEASVLASLATGVLRRRDGVKALLEQALETFHMSSATLFDGNSVIEVAGDQPPSRREDSDVVVDAGQDLTLALRGHPLPSSERRLLDAFATQVAAVVQRDRLAVQAADAARLRQVDVVRTSLLAAVSHDLRTPLAAIKAAVSTLRDDQIQLQPADRDALLESAGSSVDRLDSLLSNLLDMSRLQTGGVRPVMQPVGVDELVHRACVGVPQDRVEVAAAESLPLVETDVGLAERVLANLVENAVRYAGHVRITAAAVSEGDRRRVEISVADDGPGVPDPEKALLFEPFQRLGDSPHGAGVGLGLAVARGLSEAVGGVLRAEDTPGGGLTMLVSLPIVEAS